MGTGPRDWNPPGYWDDKPERRSTSTFPTNTPVLPPVRRRSSAMAILSLLFGCAAVVLTLAPIWSSQSVRLVWTTVGLTAILFGAIHLRRWRRGLARGRALASIGIGAGSIATVLLVWGALWAELPGLPAPPQVAFAGALATPAWAAPSTAPAPSTSPAPTETEEQASGDDRTYEPRAGRVVPPTPNAQAVEPTHQLQTNLVATAYEICVGLASYREQHGTLPDSLEVEDDGRISTNGGTFSAIVPAYMRISFAPNAPDGTAYLTVADTESGMAMSCVRSGGEAWITNS